MFYNEKNKSSMELENKIKCVLMDFEVNEVTLQEATNRILLLLEVVGKSEQLADHKCKPMVNADWSYLRCECGKRFEPEG